MARNDLRLDEMQRIQRTLRKRYRAGVHGNILDVGFGAALESGRMQPERGACLTFLVRRKRHRPRRQDAIAPSVGVRLKRGRHFAQLVFPTDVVEVGQITTTGRRLEYTSRHVTTGVVLAWRTPGESRLSWGLVTVGHPFPRWQALGPSRRRVTVHTRRGTIAGVLIARSDSRRNVDAAIARVEKQELIDKRLITRSQSRHRIAARDVARLSGDPQRSGETLRVGGTRPFVVHAYFPLLHVPRVGQIAHVVSVLSGRPGTFARGTSGSPWRWGNQAACVQVAGRAADFQQGFGQALTTVVEWAAGALRKHPGAEPESLRTVALF
jgi:hypothetical protein